MDQGQPVQPSLVAEGALNSKNKQISEDSTPPGANSINSVNQGVHLATISPSVPVVNTSRLTQSGPPRTYLYSQSLLRILGYLVPIPPPHPATVTWLSHSIDRVLDSGTRWFPSCCLDRKVLASLMSLLAFDRKLGVDRHPPVES